MSHVRGPIILSACLVSSVLACVDFGIAVPAFAPADASLVDVVTSASTDGGCVEESVPPSDLGPQIRMQSLSVDHPLLELQSGDVVTWTNADSMEHTATAGAPGDELPSAMGGFGSPVLGTGARWAFRFCAPREVLWFCRTHPAQMRDYRLVIR